MQKNVENNTVEILLEKDLTANNVDGFKKSITECINEVPDIDEMVLDLSETQNIDSIGVTFVVNLFKRMQNEGKIFRIIGASEDVKSLFKLMKLDQFFDLEG